MTVAELIAAYRQRLHDDTPPYFADDAHVITRLNAAQTQAALRAKLLWHTAVISVPAGQPSVVLPDRLFELDSVHAGLNGQLMRPVRLTGWDEVQRRGLAPRREPGRPRLAVHDPGRNELAIYPAPANGCVVEVSGYRLPLVPMTALTDSPEIPDYQQADLVEWVAYSVLSSQDSQLYDLQAAELALARFTAAFGPQRSAALMHRHARRQRYTTGYGGID